MEGFAVTFSNNQRNLSNPLEHVSVNVQHEAATADDDPAELLGRILSAGHTADAEELFRRYESFFNGDQLWIHRAAFSVRNAQAGRPNMFAPWIIGDTLYKCAYYPADVRWWQGLTERHVPPVFLAVHAGRIDVANFIVQHGEGDVLNQQGHASGWTALHWAVRLGLPEIANRLMDVGTSRLNVSLEDPRGNTPLDYGAEGSGTFRAVLSGPDDAIDKLLNKLEEADLRRLTDSLAAIQALAEIILQVTFSGVSPGSNGWVFNFMAFVFAMATSLAAVANRLPSTQPAERARLLVLQMAGVLLAVSVACVLCAFGMSQFAYMPEYKAINIIIPVGVAVVVCTVMLLCFLARLLSPYKEAP